MLNLKEISNQELATMRHFAYEAEMRTQNMQWMHDTKASVSRRTTAVSQEVCRRLVEGTIEFDDNGELK